MTKIMFQVEQGEEKSFQSKFLSPGINQNLVITKFEAVEREGSKPKLVVTWSNKEGQTATGDLYMSPIVAKTKSSLEMSMESIKHIWARHFSDNDKKWTDLNTYMSSAGDSLPKLAELLTAKFTGLVFDEVLLNGEEIAGKEGKQNWIKAIVKLAPFCSTKKAPIKLVYDPNLNIKRLPNNTTTAELSAPASGSASW